MTVNLYHVHQITTLLKHLMMLFDLLESTETLVNHSEIAPSVFCVIKI